MRLLEERKDYILYYYFELGDDRPSFKIKSPRYYIFTHNYCKYVTVVLQDKNSTNEFSNSKKLKNLEKDLKILSNKVIKEWKKEVQNATY